MSDYLHNIDLISPTIVVKIILAVSIVSFRAKFASHFISTLSKLDKITYSTT